eukprot:TRINITY_DN7064_c0_g1_i3.p1 TRINITY_DN7064_c0_g1~~TRINITY_DN7064_c0_g1_i3.p1  ORF type:complete len:156 (-),score=15.69 TRINITY_DN7064_c0_g1_i3:396-863(-)
MDELLRATQRNMDHLQSSLFSPLPRLHGAFDAYAHPPLALPSVGLGAGVTRAEFSQLQSTVAQALADFGATLAGTVPAEVLRGALTAVDDKFHVVAQLLDRETALREKLCAVVTEMGQQVRISLQENQDHCSPQTTRTNLSRNRTHDARVAFGDL